MCAQLPYAWLLCASWCISSPSRHLPGASMQKMGMYALQKDCKVGSCPGWSCMNILPRACAYCLCMFCGVSPLPADMYLVLARVCMCATGGVITGLVFIGAVVYVCMCLVVLALACVCTVKRLPHQKSVCLAVRKLSPMYS